MASAIINQMSFHEIEEEEELRGTYKLVVSAKAAKKRSFV